MKNTFLSLLICFLSLQVHAQLKGVVEDKKQNKISFVNIYVEGTYIGTTTNDKGAFELPIKEVKENFVVIFQCLGFKTQKHNLQKSNLPKQWLVTLVEEEVNLTEVVVSSKDNPANEIIKKAISFKDKNKEKTARFTADFYSKGVFKLKNVPKKILGQEIGDLGGSLDSTGSGIIYLSETFSKIKFEKPNNLNETIIASKVSGRDNGYSFNTARSTRFDFYDNTLDFSLPIISPIANQAFQYYNFKLEGTFFTADNQLVNKIKVIPKRDPEPVFEGYIYILEDSWAIYAIDLHLKGYRGNNEFLENLNIQQSFSYNAKEDIWAKNIQTLDILAGAFGIKFQGKFQHVFTNYSFVEAFEKKTFTNQLVRVEKESNKKDLTFWNNERPVPLTEEENNDYEVKDSIQKIRTSKPYLDSIDAIKNKFKWNKIITGYTYRNSFKEKRFGYKGINKLAQFNTVQGWNLETGFFYLKENDEKNTFKTFGLDFQFGFSDETWRPVLYYRERFNNINRATIYASLGNTVQQFNSKNPIKPIINSVMTLFLKNNYMKLYEKNFIQVGFQQELVNGIYFYGNLEYAHRKPLFNRSNYSWSTRNKEYTSNNPLDPQNQWSTVMQPHQIMIFDTEFRIRFGQKYIERPDAKFNYRNSDYPTLNISYRKGMLSSINDYDFEYLSIATFYDNTFGNKGTFGLNIKAGTFFGSESVSFADFRHFRDNQTRISTGQPNYDTFNIAPFYEFSTGDRFFELHTEHNFNGYIMNKIPLLRALKSELVIGYHLLKTPTMNHYEEYTIGLDRLGFGKFKFFRVDYIKAYENGNGRDGIVLGMKFLDIFE